MSDPSDDHAGDHAEGHGLDDLLDELVAEYSDRASAGEPMRHGEALARVPPEARPGLERCLKMIDAGLARAPSAAHPLAPGMRLGRYELLRELGRGGMALVWLARDEELRRPVALKLLRPGLAIEERHVARFQREALAVAQLRHPHVVQVHDVGSAGGWHYIAMEYVEGPTLATVIEALAGAERRRPDELVRATGVPSLAAEAASFEQAVCRLLAPVADALHAAHEAGLVHRDVKPSNVLIQRDGRAMVADFGLAKSDGDPALSLTGDTLGTPYYMSPEQASLQEARVDHRTDVYSLGVTLYETLSGKRPFEGRHVLEVFEAIRTRFVPGLRSVWARATKDAAAACAKAMAREPDGRYASAALLADELRRLGRGEPSLARREGGGSLRRGLSAMRLVSTGHYYEYRSQRSFLGLPLVHLVGGRRYPGQPRRIAKGWIAFGDVAVGGLACGGMAFGGVACGGISAGLLFGWGGITAGLLAFGGIALGGAIFAGMGIGWLAFGGIVLGYGAIGGLVRGVYAVGGRAYGEHVWCESLGRLDPEATAWFEELLPRFLQWW